MKIRDFMIARWKPATAVTAILFALMATGCFSVSVNATHHLPSKAGKSAQEFAEVAFVNGDSGRAFALLADELKQQITEAQVASALSQMHPNGRPVTVKAIEFEPAPGQAAMNIFLIGEASGEKFYYRCFMMGTSSSGYRVGGFFRSNGPPPPSSARKSISD